MSTFEMIVWGLIVIYAAVVLGGLGFMAISGKAPCPESDHLVAQADEDEYRAGANF
jgi:hypothetical protein